MDFPSQPTRLVFRLLQFVSNHSAIETLDDTEKLWKAFLRWIRGSDAFIGPTWASRASWDLRVPGDVMIESAGAYQQC